MYATRTFRLAALLSALCLSTVAHATDVTGAGSSFVYPVLSKWSQAYSQKTQNRINYQSIGSGGGIAQIKAGTVDFGASDAPLSTDDLQKSGLGHPGELHFVRCSRWTSGSDQEAVAKGMKQDRVAWLDPGIVGCDRRQAVCFDEWPQSGRTTSAEDFYAAVFQQPCRHELGPPRAPTEM